MALRKVEITRQFLVEKGGKKISVKDPNPNLTLEEVKKYLSITYPEILNCSVGNPEIKNEVSTFTFKANVATKG